MPQCAHGGQKTDSRSCFSLLRRFWGVPRIGSLHLYSQNLTSLASNFKEIFFNLLSVLGARFYFGVCQTNVSQSMIQTHFQPSVVGEKEEVIRM